MSSAKDQIANRVLQESYCDINEQLNVSEVSARLYTNHRITLSDLNQLQNVSGNLTDQQRRHILYTNALAGKGKQALDAFLDALDDTASHYEPHSLLARKLRAKLRECEHLVSEQDGHNEPSRKLHSYQSYPSNLPARPNLTHRPVHATSSLPEAGHTQADSSQEQEVADVHQPLHIKNFHKSVDEGLGSMVAINNHSEGASQHAANKQRPVLTSADRHPKDTDKLEYAQYDAVAARHGSNTTEGSGHETDGATRKTRPSLERSNHSLCDMIPVKLILLGNIGVGKTSLVNRFLKNAYSESVPSTTGGTRINCYFTHNEKKVNVELAIWDTAGLEKFNCISANFYQKVNVVIIVFDMTDNESETSLHAVDDWNKQICHYTSKHDIPIILAGNKCKSLGVNTEIGSHAEHMVKKLGFDSFMEVSAKENYQVEALFQRAIDLGMKTHNPDDDSGDSDVDSNSNLSPHRKCIML